MLLLDLIQTKKILKKYQIPLIKTKTVNSLEKARTFAESNNYPVTLKIYSPKIIHRTEKKAIKNNIKNEKELEKSYSFLKNNFKGKIIIQPKIKGKEIIIGIKKDPSFGKVIMVGMGGIFTEIFKDVSLRINPIKEKEAKKMLKELKSYPLLKGFRNQKGVNTKKLVKLIVKVSELAKEEKNIKEIDFNPVIVNSKQAVIVDPKIYYKN